MAIALIEQGADPLEAVSIIRETCPGAINTPQLKVYFFRFDYLNLKSSSFYKRTNASSTRSVVLCRAPLYKSVINALSGKFTSKKKKVITTNLNLLL